MMLEAEMGGMAVEVVISYYNENYGRTCPDYSLISIVSK